MTTRKTTTQDKKSICNLGSQHTKLNVDLLLLKNSLGMDQTDLSQCPMPKDVQPGVAAAAVAPAAVTDSAAFQPAASSRPRRPQRSAKVEGSIDVGDAKAETTNVRIPTSDQQGDHIPDGLVVSRPKPSRVGGPKGPGHHPVRAASVPHPPASRPVAPHLNPQAQRALSVAGTADTQAQTVDDFRQVLPLTAHYVSINHFLFPNHQHNGVILFFLFFFCSIRVKQTEPPELLGATVVKTLFL